MRIPAAVSRALSDHTPAFVALTGAIAYFVPGAFAWVHGEVQTAILGLVMLTMGLTLTAEDFRILAARPFDILIGAVAQYTLMPLIAFALVRGLGLPRGVGVGLILVGVCPGGVSSNIMSFLCRGDVAFSVGMTAASTLLAPLATPFLMKTLAGEMVDIDAFAMFRSVVLVTIAPVVLGFAVNRIFDAPSRPRLRKIREGYLPLLPGVAVLGLACIVGAVVAAQGERFLRSGAMIFVAVFLHNSLGYALGYAASVVARFAPKKRRTLAIEVGMQNAGLATVLATKHFPSLPEAALASAVSCVWHSLSGALMAGLFNFLDRISSVRNAR